MAVQALASVDAALGWLAQHDVTGLCTDSRRVRPGDAFVAWPGYGVDGRQFVASARAAGARACLVEAEGVQAFESLASEPAVATLADLKACTGSLASRFYGSPSDDLEVVAITGTNGKTSTAWWVAQGLEALGRRCAIVGTLGVGEPPSSERTASLVPTGMTTPDPVTLHAALRRFVREGVVACAIEATSIGLAEHRMTGTRIDTAVFTNFTLDHLDYHGTMTAYWHAKEQLFDWPGLAAAVINVDAAQGEALARSLRSRPMDLWTVSMHGDARLRASDVRHGDAGLSFDVQEGSQRATVHTALVGQYNVANLLGVMAALRAGGAPLQDIADVCAALTPVPGRLQRLCGSADDPEVVIDYAHTPDALHKSLQALQPLALRRGGLLWCVFGCGGNRDAGKRPLMGRLAQQEAQRVVITSDNPRLEPPADIVRQIVAGLSDADRPAAVIVDRRAAIEHAVAHAQPADVILIAGKGHEDYQDIGGVRQAFSDIQAATAALRGRRGARS